MMIFMPYKMASYKNYESESARGYQDVLTNTLRKKLESDLDNHLISYLKYGEEINKLYKHEKRNLQ